MEHTEPTNNVAMKSDELSLKDLINQLYKLIALFKQKFTIILLFSLIGGSLGFFYAWRSKPLYEAKMTFVMRADANNAMSSLAGLSSLLGGGTSAASSSPMDRIIQLLGSDRIVGEALLSNAVVDEKNDVLATHLIRLAKFDEKWAKDTILNKASFKELDKFGAFNFSQRKAIKQLNNYIAGEGGILDKNFDKKSGIFTMGITHENEDLAIALNNAVYAHLVDFYSKEAVSTIASKVDILQFKVDSIRAALGNTQSASAKQVDQGLGILLQQDRVQQKKLGLKETMLTVMYAEAQKNLEQLSFIQATTSPSFSIIDQPYSPLGFKSKSKLKFAFGGMFIFGFFTFFYFTARYWFKDIMK